MLIPLAFLALQAATPTGPAVPPLAASSPAAAPAARWPVRDADFVIKDFRFASGETLPELRIHYSTLGKPHRNAPAGTACAARRVSRWPEQTAAAR